MNTDDYINLFDELDDNDQTDNFIDKKQEAPAFPGASLQGCAGKECRVPQRAG
jgi:hypothetical protein